MKRIIVPTDFSDNAWNAFLYAVELAKQLKSEITILNSFQAPQAVGTDLVSAEGLLQKASENGLEEWLLKINNSNIGNNLVINEESVEAILRNKVELKLNRNGRTGKTISRNT